MFIICIHNTYTSDHLKETQCHVFIPFLHCLLQHKIIYTSYTEIYHTKFGVIAEVIVHSCLVNEEVVIIIVAWLNLYRRGGA